eukprot:sb/3476688/
MQSSWPEPKDSFAFFNNVNRFSLDDRVAIIGRVLFSDFAPTRFTSVSFILSFNSSKILSTALQSSLAVAAVSAEPFSSSRLNIIRLQLLSTSSVIGATDFLSTFCNLDGAVAEA